MCWDPPDICFLALAHICVDNDPSLPFCIWGPDPLPVYRIHSLSVQSTCICTVCIEVDFITLMHSEETCIHKPFTAVTKKTEQFVFCAMYRLSDFLFVAARYAAKKEGKEEIIYHRVDPTD